MKTFRFNFRGCNALFFCWIGCMAWVWWDLRIPYGCYGLVGVISIHVVGPLFFFGGLLQVIIAPSSPRMASFGRGEVPCQHGQTPLRQFFAIEVEGTIRCPLKIGLTPPPKETKLVFHFQVQTVSLPEGRFFEARFCGWIARLERFFWRPNLFILCELF